MIWTREQIQKRLLEIKAKGFLPIPDGMYRRDEGIVGQILEREFNIKENNISVRDLGSFELKGMRETSSKLTLCHKKTDNGLSPIEVFDRFGYEKPSNRDKLILKKKLFTTVTSKPNKLGLRLVPFDDTRIDMYHNSEFICSWNLSESLEKINAILLVFAETKGATASRDELFHFTIAHFIQNLKPLSTLVSSNIIVIDFCIDKQVDSSKSPHDRGPHIRIPKSKLFMAYEFNEKIL
ncbi:MAG: MvaI/BcnI family restriction endonuclease [Sedimentisphaerales bacterium]